MTKFIKDSLSDLRGAPSSTRVKSWYTLWFMFFIIPVFIGITLWGAHFLSLKEEALTSYLFIMLGTLMSMLLLLLTAAFIPSQLNKRTETNEMIELAKTLGKDPLDGFIKE